ncbi:Uncharacterized protein TCM_020977 [Theobroma cacao]|uniref:RNase H type-1 domain-containing protein n=1 Tax=Theobroma cacao TaxID=3641 RepID=A0A061EV96_THECC|nr:Uncharacterized protein TCM_020977 [Theobroma cacao]
MKDRRLWKMAYFATVWTIWKCKIEVVFEGWEGDSEKCCDSARLRAATWRNAKRPKEFSSVLNTYKQIPTSNQTKKKVKERTGVEWELPQQDQMKFNVNGTARRCLGLARIDGILRNHKGEVKVIFSKSIGSADSNLVEILVIGEAFIIFTS